MARLYAEISFVGVLGTWPQRRRTCAKFVRWPDSGEPGLFRARVDRTSRRLIVKPTKGLERIRQGPTGPLPVNGKFSALRPSAKPFKSTAQRNGSIDELRASLLSHWPNDDPSKDANADQDVIGAIDAGRTVLAEDLFSFMVRAVIRSEQALLPKKAIRIAKLMIALTLLLLPFGVQLYICGRSPEGMTGMSMKYIVWAVTSFLPQFLMILANLSFIEVAARDMWRRRALLRCCAAFLTTQHAARKGIPAEIDALPILDMRDPTSVIAWRKLRQMSFDWGYYYYVRIQGFVCAFVLAMTFWCADLALSLQVPAYEEVFPISITKLIIFFGMLLPVCFCLVILAVLGEQVNGASAYHQVLLRKQRLAILSQHHLGSGEKGQAAEAEDEGAAAAGSLLEMLCTDLAETQVAEPVTLLGLYCGYSLLSLLYVVPLTMVFWVGEFCMNDMEKCVNGNGYR